MNKHNQKIGARPNWIQRFVVRLNSRGHWIARLLYAIGISPWVSSGLCGSTTYGYGKLNANGYWQFDLYPHNAEARREA